MHDNRKLEGTTAFTKADLSLISREMQNQNVMMVNCAQIAALDFPGRCVFGFAPVAVLADNAYGSTRRDWRAAAASRKMASPDG